jgi:dihydroxy-acid dehydratase
MQEMLYPTSYLKSAGLADSCALITDGRFSGGSSGLSVGHISPEAAAGGEIALIQNGDMVQINIPERKLYAEIEPEEMNRRREVMNRLGEGAFKPSNRDRIVSKSLKAYSLLVSSADTGAIRIID